ncbi:MAG: hypothetical protein HUU57_04650 [Bdellovibrio sp.]|nr:hypothetical protein [Bdellovibrio sp.]
MDVLPKSKSFENEAYYWAFFVPLWILPICLFVFGYYEPISLMLYYHLVFRLPHFLMTYIILQDRNFFVQDNLKKVFRFFGPPLIIIALVALFGIYDEKVPRYFVLGTFVFGFYHNSAQAMGISLMFLQERSAGLVRIIKVAFLVLYILALEPMIIFAFKVSHFFDPLVLSSLRTVLAFLTLYILAKTYRRGLGTKFILYYLSSIFVLFPWSFYDNYLQQFFVHNLHHSINYLGIGLALTNTSGRSIFKSSKAWKIYGTCVAISGILAVFFHQDLGRLKNTFGFINCFFFVHYYVESLIWKDKHLNLKDIEVFKLWKSSAREVA